MLDWGNPISGIGRSAPVAAGLAQSCVLLAPKVSRRTTNELGRSVTLDLADVLCEQGVGLGSPRVSVVVPARNEAKNLPHVLPLIPKDVHEVILVDGNSVDDTISVAKQCLPGIKVVRQTRRGKGNALACGFRAVTGDIIVMLDADGSADPAEIAAFVEALVNGADFAKGTRFANGGGSRDITRLRRTGNTGLNKLVNLLFKTRYTDLCYGYNAFWAYLLPVLDLPEPTQPGTGSDEMIWGDGFEIETLINVRVAHAGAQIAEVGSVELERIHGVSNLNAVSDGLRVLRTIGHERVMARKRRAERERLLARGAGVSVVGPLTKSISVDESAVTSVLASDR